MSREPLRIFAQTLYF